MEGPSLIDVLMKLFVGLAALLLFVSWIAFLIYLTINYFYIASAIVGILIVYNVGDWLLE